MTDTKQHTQRGSGYLRLDQEQDKAWRWARRLYGEEVDDAYPGRQLLPGLGLRLAATQPIDSDGGAIGQERNVGAFSSFAGR